jgi:FMN phosphatase YigB (HAD superfamily)
VLAAVAAPFARRLRQWLTPLVARPARVWTFDVFDTAIVRLVLVPDHLHWLVARHARARGLATLDPGAWREARIAAEADARRARQGEEITLDDIYRALQARLPALTGALPALAALEVELEHRLVRPIAATRARLERLRQAGSRTGFVSDTYLDGATVAGQLRSCGYDGEALVVSSARGHSKARGDLYATVAADYAVSRRVMAHLGDNRRADVVNARRAGLHGQLFSDARPTRYERRLFERAGRDDLASVMAGAARAARLSFDPGSPHDAALIRVSAGVAAPLLTGFALWTLEQARADGVTRLYFLARDGQILAPLAGSLAAWTGAAVECRYLLGSRQAFHLPALPAEPLAAIAAAFAASAGQRVGTVLSELEFEAADVEAVCRAAGLTPDERVTAAGAARVQASLAPAHRRALGARLSARSEGLRAYLDREGLLERGVRCAIVDLGWKGNLQRRLERACGGRRLRGYYYDLDHVPADLAGTVATFAGGAFRNAELLETFCRATHTSVQGFRRDGQGAAVVDLASWTDRDARDWGVDLQQATIHCFAGLLQQALPADLAATDGLVARLRAAGLAVFREFIESPGRDEAAAYGSVRHARGQRHEEDAEIAPRLSAVELCHAMCSRAYRVRLNTWMPGTVVRSGDSLTGRLALGLLRLRQRRRLSAAPAAAAPS